MQSRKPLIVGLGEVGSALAEVLKLAGPVLLHDVKPVDISEAVGVMHICFPYYNAEQFQNAAHSYIRRFNPALVIINSTVVPGTTRDITHSTGIPIAYSPVRGKHVRMAEDLLRYTKFVSSLTAAVTRQAEEHFQAVGIKTDTMDCPESLELAKLAETTYFGLQITFAQELSRFASRMGANYLEAITFFEEIDFLPGKAYLPGFIGGHCVIPNIHLLRRVVASPLLQAMLESNELRRRELEQAKTSEPDPDGMGRAPK
jgi:UDP-glucose 6-dehydrogenase